MKTLLNTLILAALLMLPASAMSAEPAKQPAEKTHKVVFEVAMDGADKWQGALRNVEKTALEKLRADGVIFAACENTMQREKLEKKDLVAFSTTVDSGVSEVIRKQEDGYSYIKSGG